MYLFLAERGLGLVTQFLALFLLAGQSGLMYYIGEARPYFPFAATAVGCLTYLTTDKTSPRWRYVRILGWISLYVGSVMHLYFLLALPAVLLFNLFYRSLASSTRPGWRQLLGWCRPKVVGGAVLLAVVVGWLTWMRPQETNQLGAFEWMGGNGYSAITRLGQFHFEFMGTVTAAAALLIIELFLMGWLIFNHKCRKYADLLASTVLLVFSIGTSLAIALSSVANSYAISPRQLVLGPALVVLSLSWQVGSLIALGRRVSLSPPSPVSAVLLSSAIGGGLAYLVYILLYNRSGVALTIATVSFCLTAVFAGLWRGAEGAHKRWALSGLTSGTAIFLSLQISQNSASLKATTLFLVAIELLLVGTFIVVARLKTVITLGSLLAALAVLFGLTMAYGAVQARILVLGDELATRGAILEQLDDIDELELSRLMNASREEQTTLRDEFGGEWWVRLANLNSLSGGDVWPIFDQF